jgi:hypothetical protein
MMGPASLCLSSLQEIGFSGFAAKDDRQCFDETQ